MTIPLKVCGTCQAAIPAGALYCLACGASSPTEIAATVPEGLTAVRTAPGGSVRTSLAGVDLEARRALVQQVLGDSFQVKGLIGRGGFGEVWAAVDTQLGRDVAVKVLRPEIGTNPDYRARFRRETRAVAKLRHPAIVPIYHVGEHEGTVFFIMPLVQGITLRAVLADPAGLAHDEAVRILIEAAGALREAHAAGIVHRDIKPENIMLEGPQRRALLMDFGVAKLEGASEEGITETDTVIGSPEYMSPEQATGRALDARSDIYSLGVVAYRMLAGRLPFDADTPREVLAHHVLSPPDPLEKHVVVAASVSDAVMKCLAKAPGDRWASADAFGKALAAAAPRASQMATAMQVVPSAVSRQPSAASSFSRPRTVVLLGMLLIMALAAAAPWPIAKWRQQRSWRSASTAIAAEYQRGADSLGALAEAFRQGDLTGPQLAAARQELLGSLDAQVEEQYGGALDDSAKWPVASLIALHRAAGRLGAAGPGVAAFGLRVSDVPGCRLGAAGDTLVAADEARADNCWFAADGAAALTAPLEYYARFRTAQRLPAGAGLGLAWCRSDGECRIAFLWPGSPVAWGAHRPHRGLAALALGQRVRLDTGEHQLRVHWQDGLLRVWLDGGVILERRSTADATYLEQPGSVNFVVQNTTVELIGPGAFGVVGARR